nr:uncharacterized protein LOC129143573 [Pan troglodytes]
MAPSGLGGRRRQLGARGPGALGGARSGGRTGAAAPASLRAVIKHTRGARRGHTPHAPRAHARPPRPGRLPDEHVLCAAPRAPASGATQAALPAGRPALRRSLRSRPATAFRTRRNRFCGLRDTHLLSWFPKLHVLSAENLQIICCLYWAPAACQVLPPALSSRWNNLTEKTDINQIPWKRGRQGKEQRESKIAPIPHHPRRERICPSSCGTPICFFQVRGLPFMPTSVPDPLL